MVSDFASTAQGSLGFEPVGLLVDTDGTLLVTDTQAGTDVLGGGDGNGALFRIDPVTGARVLLSDFGNAAQGPLGQSPTGVALGAGGWILVADPDGGTDVPGDGKTGGNGALYRVHPVSGMRTMLSDFGNAAQGATGLKPGGVALGPGGIVVADTEAGTGATGILFRVDAISGARTALSTFGNMAQGPLGADPFFVAVATSGQILVSDDLAGTDIPLDGHVGGNGALFAVNQTNGNRTLLSDFGNVTQGPTGVDPVGVAVVPLTQPGDALAIDLLAGTNGQGALFTVNPQTGTRLLLSDFGNGLQGPQGSDPVAVAMGSGGDILVVDEDWIVNGLGALLRVNPRDGSRTVVSNFSSGAEGPTGENPSAVALEPDGHILVADRDAGSGISGALFRVDPDTGIRTLLSDFGNAAQGPVGRNPTGVIVEADGDILVGDPDFGPADGAILRIDPATGMRTVLSDFDDPTQGATGTHPEDLTLDLAGGILVNDTLLGTGNRGRLMRVDPASGFRTVLSDFGNAAQGPLGQTLVGVAVRETGDILVLDDNSGTGSIGTLFVVNPVTGMRIALSDFGLLGQGPLGAALRGLTIFRVNAPPAAPLNDFLCYKVKATGGNRCDANAPNPARVCETEEDCGGVEDVTDFCNRFKLLTIPTFIRLVDQFETALYGVGKPTSLCNPANVNGDDPTAPAEADHLGPYQIGLAAKVCAAGSPSNAGKSCKKEPDCGGAAGTAFCQKSTPHVQRTGVTIDNRFGTLSVDTVKASRVLVPTAKSLLGPIAAPTPGIDHFTCYDVRVTPGTPKFPKGIQTVAVDQFNQPKLFDVVRPTRLCAPANKNGESPGAETHAAHLVCYQVKPASGQPKHVRVLAIYTNNQLGPEVHDTVKEEELCVVSDKTAP